MIKPMKVQTTDLRRKMPEVLDHIIGGGTVKVHRNTRYVTVMLPPPPEGMKYELVPDRPAGSFEALVRGWYPNADDAVIERAAAAAKEAARQSADMVPPRRDEGEEK